MASGNVWKVAIFVGTYEGRETACEMVIRPDGSSHWLGNKRLHTGDLASILQILGALPGDEEGTVKARVIRVKGSPYDAREEAWKPYKAAHEARKAKPEAKPEYLFDEDEDEEEAKPEAKPKAKPEAKPKAKPEAKPKAKPEAKPEPAAFEISDEEAEIVGRMLERRAAARGIK